MQTIAMIPARYGSSRFPGKPLENICGKPMIWWVFHQVQKVRGISAVCVATDHAEIQEACRAQGIPVQMTGEHATSTERIYEAAKRMPADVYICVNGDEPLIEHGSNERHQAEGDDGGEIQKRELSPANAGKAEGDAEHRIRRVHGGAHPCIVQAKPDCQRRRFVDP